MGYVLGVDLGTTFTAAAVHRDGRTETAQLADRAPVVPSVLFIGQDEQLLVGEAANRRAAREPDRVARDVKRRFGDSTPLLLGGAPYSADLLTARLLQWVVDRVCQQEGTRPDRIALTHPANWGGFKLDLLRQAVQHTGLGEQFECLTVSEPHAAAIWYASRNRLADDQLVAVYDLGGGTFDAAVLRRTSSGFAMVGEPQGIERLGGIDLDDAVFAHVAGVIGLDVDEVDPEDVTLRSAVRRLRAECTAAKEALSEDTEVAIEVALPAKHTDVRLTRSELEAMARPQLSETVSALERALRSADVTAEDLERVLLVGGASRMPLVGEVVTAALGRPIALDAHPKHAVALGAAVTAARPASEAEPSGALPVAEIPTAPVTVVPPSGAPGGAAGAAAVAGPDTLVAAVPNVGTGSPEPPPSPAYRSVVVPDASLGPPPPASGPGGWGGGPGGRAPRNERRRADTGPRRATAARRPLGLRAGVASLGAVAALIVVVAVAVVVTAGNGDGSDDRGAAATKGDAESTAPPTTAEVDRDGNGRVDEPGPPRGYTQPDPSTTRATITRALWGTHDGFERVAIRFEGTQPPAVEAVTSPPSGLVRLTFPDAPPLAAPGTQQALAVERSDSSAVGMTAVLVAPTADEAWIELHTDTAVEPQVWRFVNEDGEPAVVVDLVPVDGPWATGGAE
jgi:actin-like ATPase involved in cell morphogenesis